MELLEKLRTIQVFINEESECRETSYLPEPTEAEEPYLEAASEAKQLIGEVIAEFASPAVVAEPAQQDLTDAQIDDLTGCIFSLLCGEGNLTEVLDENWFHDRVNQTIKEFLA